MQVKMRSKITSMSRNSNEVKISLELRGQVQESQSSAKEASMIGTLVLRPIMADQLKIGSTITVILSDEECNEGLV